MSANIVIYALKDPATGCVRYVGKAKDAEARLKYGHLGSEFHKKLHKSNWLRKLASIGLKPILEIIENTSESRWKERERHWIAHFKQAGHPLTNMTLGGDGGCISHTPETRKKMSDARKGKKRGQEFCEKMSRVNAGKKPSEQCRMAQRIALLGKPSHPNQKAALKKVMPGNKHASKHSYVAIDPDGMRHFVGNKLNEFCIKQSLDASRMRGLASGDPLRKSHKGWTCFSRPISLAQECRQLAI